MTTRPGIKPLELTDAKIQLPIIVCCCTALATKIVSME